MLAYPGPCLISVLRPSERRCSVCWVVARAAMLPGPLGWLGQAELRGGPLPPWAPRGSRYREREVSVAVAVGLSPLPDTLPEGEPLPSTKWWEFGLTPAVLAACAAISPHEENASKVTWCWLPA